MPHEVSIQIQLDQDAKAAREADQLEKTIPWDAAVDFSKKSAAVIDQPGLKPDPQQKKPESDTLDYHPSQKVIEMMEWLGVTDSVPHWRERIDLMIKIGADTTYESDLEGLAEYRESKGDAAFPRQKVIDKIYRDFRATLQIAADKKEIERLDKSIEEKLLGKKKK